MRLIASRMRSASLGSLSCAKASFLTRFANLSSRRKDVVFSFGIARSDGSGGGGLAVALRVSPPSQVVNSLLTASSTRDSI